MRISFLCLLLRVLITCSVVDLTSAGDDFVCSPSQPQYYVEVLSSRNVTLDECLFRIPAVPNQSANADIQVSEQNGEPDSHAWSRCQNCRLLNGSISAFGEINRNYTIDMSWSHWASHFQELSNDQLHATLVSNNVKPAKQLQTVVITRPVYVLPLITYHIGHILVDLVEQVYNSMILHYGEVRRDAVIILDVSAENARDGLQGLINGLAENIDHGNKTHKIIHGVLHSALSDLPLFSFRLFEELQLISQSTFEVIFSDLHIGLDISNTHYQLGYAYHPCLFSLGTGNSELLSLSERYQRFAAYMVNHAHDSIIDTDKHHQEHRIKSQTSPVKVAFIQRLKDRALLSLNATTTRATSLGLNWSVVHLEEMVFAEQFAMFQETDILVSIAGTALHNMLFMRPGVTAAVIIMQPGWCEWSWMYANQAVLLGIRPFIYCDDDGDGDSDNNSENATPTRRYQTMYRRFWTQGTRATKAVDVDVNTDKLGGLLQQAQQHVLTVRTSGVNSVHSEITCPGTGKEQQQRQRQQKQQHQQQQRMRAELDTSKNQHYPPKRVDNYFNTELEPFKHSLRLTDLTITPNTEGPKSWIVRFIVDFGLNNTWNNDKAFLESMPHLSFCAQTIPMVLTVDGRVSVRDEDTFQQQQLHHNTSVPFRCIPAHSRYEHTHSAFVVREYPVLSLHFWVQLSPSGGKLRHSDLYKVIDCRLVNGGQIP